MTRTLNGPGTDPINVIAVDPSNANIVYAGTQDAGIWKSTDGGVTWGPANKGLDISRFGMTVYSLAINPSNPMIVFAAAGGVYKSTDGGASWTLAAPAHGNATAVVIAPSDPNRVYVAEGWTAAFLISADGGGSWSREKLRSRLGQVTAVAVDPRDSSLVYVAGDGESLKSTDGGVTWSDAGLRYGANTIVVDPTNSRVLYASDFSDLYKSIDGARTWTVSDTGIPGPGYVDALAISAANPSTIYAGSSSKGLYKSSDGGASWLPANSGVTNSEVQAVAICPTNSSTVFAGTSDGLFESSDGGLNWSSAATSLAPAQITALAISPANSNVMYAGTGRGRIYASADNGATWTGNDLAPALQVSYGFSLFMVYAIVIDPAQPLNVYAGTLAGPAKSIDGGATWFAPDPLILGPETYFYSMTIEPDGTLLAGSAMGVFISKDGGAYWRQSTFGLVTVEPYPPPVFFAIQAVAVDPSNPSIVYAGQGRPVPLYKSIDGGSSWSQMGVGLTRADVHSIAVNPLDGQVVYAGTDQGLFKSTNGGAKWLDVKAGGPDAAAPVVVLNPVTPDMVYAGTNMGLFRSPNGGSDWSAIDLPYVVSDRRKVKESGLLPVRWKRSSRL